MHAVGLAQEGKIQVVVDDEKRAGVVGEGAEAPREAQEVASGQGLVAQLDDVSAPAQSGGGQGRKALGLLIGSDEVEAGGAEPLEEGLSRGWVNLRSWEGGDQYWTPHPA